MDATQNLLATARDLVARRQFSEAIRCLDRALAEDPDNLEELEYRGKVLQIVARHEDALSDFERILKESPATARIWERIAHSLRHLGRFEQAEQAFVEALRLSPGSLASMADLGNLHRDAGRPREAVMWLSKAVAAAPSDSSLNAMLGAALLAANEPARARSVLEKAFRLNPYDRSTLAYLYVALCRTDNLDGAKALTLSPHLIRTFQRPGSAGTDAVPDDLDERLAVHVRQHPTLQFERHGNTTRGGAHTGQLLEGDAGPVTQLVTWIEDRVRFYLGSLPQTSSHPYLAWKPDHWDIDIWGIVIQSGGHQVSHVHTDGWVSGVYYAVVPGRVQAAEEKETNGCLVFGRPIESLCGKTVFPEQTIRPRPGRLILFPSYLWHRTMPYEEEADRICLAFDIRPRR